MEEGLAQRPHSVAIAILSVLSEEETRLTDVYHYFRGTQRQRSQDEI